MGEHDRWETDAPSVHISTVRAKGAYGAMEPFEYPVDISGWAPASYPELLGD